MGIVRSPKLLLATLAAAGMLAAQSQTPLAARIAAHVHPTPWKAAPRPRAGSTWRRSTLPRSSGAPAWNRRATTATFRPPATKR